MNKPLLVYNRPVADRVNLVNLESHRRRVQFIKVIYYYYFNINIIIAWINYKKQTKTSGNFFDSSYLFGMTNDSFCNKCTKSKYITDKKKQ